MRSTLMTLGLMTVGTLALSACTMIQSNATATTGPGRKCHGEALGEFVGQGASEELATRILTASGARMIRWVPKGGVVTMDYREDRVTVQLDGTNHVEHASCG